ncbi:MAG TPA: oxygen-independent coproporphyrinogen III oxidase [Alphaproteobacteria bacterium]|nr:oxygen-independent coproporphyrinogen III oxidase [Alphaproteobacteria bacterium]
MRSNILSKYLRSVPRYTSYPTAPHFTPEVNADRYREWLVGLDEATPLSLYLHIPFCRSLCWFCGCRMQVANSYDPIQRYLKLLLNEIALVANVLSRCPPVSHIHLGGGTPTMLSARDLASLANTLRNHFDIEANAEFAVEIDPRVLTESHAIALGASGVNRASLGVQDFAPVVQKAINRIQPYEVTARAVEMLRSHNVSSINLDLMYGLPYQTVEGVVATVERAVRLDPDRLAVFGYAHVPWMKRHQRLIPEEALPRPEERTLQAAAAASALDAHGYVPIGLDHFARPSDPLVAALTSGRLRRNFQGYTADRAETLIGFGVSAIGTLPDGYVQNASDSRAYGEAIARGELATARGIALADDDRLRRDIIQSLMCKFEAPVDAFCRAYGREPGSLESERRTVAAMVADGLVTWDGGKLRVTAKGRPLVRVICAAFDRYLTSGEAGHSVAV